MSPFQGFVDCGMFDCNNNVALSGLFGRKDCLIAIIFPILYGFLDCGMFDCNNNAAFYNSVALSGLFGRKGC
jgi:hypothetical protein